MGILDFIVQNPLLFLSVGLLVAWLPISNWLINKTTHPVADGSLELRKLIKLLESHLT